MVEGRIKFNKGESGLNRRDLYHPPMKGRDEEPWSPSGPGMAVTWQRSYSRVRTKEFPRRIARRSGCSPRGAGTDV